MLAADINAALAALTSLAPELPPAPSFQIDWGEILPLLARHGLAPLVSYQLDYRLLSRFRPPAWARDHLRAHFNAAVNDNVVKVTHLRRLLAQEGMPPSVLLGEVALLDALYPHVGFRPVEEVGLWVRSNDLGRASELLAEGGLAAGPRESRLPLAARLRSPEIGLSLWRTPPGLSLTPAQSEALWSRARPASAFGRAALRLAPADAVCGLVGGLAQEGFGVPRIRLADLREALAKLDAGTGFHAPDGEPLRSADLASAARALGLQRPLWTALRLAAELFPETAAKASALRPRLPARVEAVLLNAVVRPALDPRKARVLRPLQALRRRLLAR